MIRLKLKTIRGTITKLCNLFDHKLSNNDIQIDYLKLTLLELNDINKRVSCLNEERVEELDTMLKEENGSEHEDLVEQELQKIEDYNCRIKLVIHTAEIKLDELSEASHKNFGYSNLNYNSTENRINLPKLHLPTFSGNVLEWTEFYETFSAAVCSSNLSNVEKFIYLKGQLKGEALSLVNGLALTNANFENALDLLKDRYGDNNIVIRAHVRELLNLEQLRSETTNFRSFLDKINVNIRSLATLNITEEHYGVFLIEIILSRVPDQIKMSFSKLGNANQNLKALLLIIENETRGFELVKATQSQSDLKTQGEKLKVPKNTFSFPISTVTENCAFCKSKEHKSSSCSLFHNCGDVQKRSELVKNARLCFNCLGQHAVRNCSSKIRCYHCQKSHHTKLHFHKKIDDKAVEAEKIVATPCLSYSSTISVLPTLKFMFQSEYQECYVPICVLLDSGSQGTFILRRSLLKLKYEVVNRKFISITGIYGKSVSGFHDVVKLILIDSNKTSKEIEFIAVEELCGTAYSTKKDIVIKIDNGEEATSTFSDIEAIIGNDQYYQFATGNNKMVTPNLAAIETVSGWTLQGSLQKDDHKILSMSTLISKIADHRLEDVDIRRFWELETPYSDQKDFRCRYLKSLNDTLVFNDGRYSVCFPWKECVELKSTYEKQALMRLKSVVSKLVEKGILHQYDKILKGYLSDGIAELVNENTECNNVVRFLPHHPVVREVSNKTKLRVVLDASAKINKLDHSLNDCLYEGRNLLPNIISVLLRFRRYRYGETADIEKAFLQIEIQEKERDVLRYFWYDEELNDEMPKSEPKIYRMKRVPFGVKSSPFLLCGVIKQHLERYTHLFPKTVKYISENLYMDDLVNSFPSLTECDEVKRESKIMFEEMSMNMTKWQRTGDKQEALKVLGITWMSASDELVLENSSFPIISTKRQLASFVCGFWDPMGLCAPYIMIYKLLLQECWKLKLAWDDALPEEVTKIISKYEEVNSKCSCIIIPRWIKFELGTTEYHVYCDASRRAYGACLYVRIFDENEKIIYSNLVLAKSRLTPIKQMTIPRLELSGALLASRLMKYFCEEMGEPRKIRAFCDSKVVLHWIKNEEKRSKEFVQNRIDEIREAINPLLWSYVSTKENPADLISRGTSLDEISKSKVWWHGPELFFEQEEKTLNEAEYKIITDECFNEKTLSFPATFTEPLIEFERFSSFKKLTRTLAYVVRVCRKILKIDNFTEEELAEAEIKLIEICQKKVFVEEIKALKGGVLINKNSKLFSLNPFIDEFGLLRVNTRLQCSNLSFDEIYPIIIPHSSILDRLIVNHYHEKLLHAGTSSVMSELRKRFWLMRARRVIKGSILDCRVCRRKKSKAVLERWAPLPPERSNVDIFSPFRNVGLDYLGPIPYEGGKSYVLLFTCLQVRAVHLELTLSLTSKDFLDALNRFVCRRGVPSVIYSDNAKTFKGSEGRVTSLLQVKWKYITERSPHKGGAWERMVRCVKQPLRIALRLKTHLDIISLQTLLCNIESVINKRPLTYVSSDHEELLPLTPAHFLFPQVISNNGESSSLTESLNNLLAMQGKQTISFFKRWREEYLTQLKAVGNINCEKKLKEGDVVLIDDDSKREKWKLAKIEKVFEGRDGIVRSVLCYQGGKVYKRGINRVFLLESAGEY